MIRLIVLSPPIIDRMLQDTAFHAFSFLKTPLREPVTTKMVLKQMSKGCGGCNGKRRQQMKRIKRKIKGGVDYNGIKRMIANAGPEQQAVLKELLGCEQLKVRYANAKGKANTQVL